MYPGLSLNSWLSSFLSLPKARITYMSTIPGTPLLKAEETAEDREGDVRGSKGPLLDNKGLPLRVGQ